MNIPKKITPEWLKNNPTAIFVFGDNTIRMGKAGAAKCRDEWNTWGFITKRYPGTKEYAYYTPEEYQPIFDEEFEKLEQDIQQYDAHTFIISKLGAGLANKHNIREKVIEPKIYELKKYPNVVFLEDL